MVCPNPHCLNKCGQLRQRCVVTRTTTTVSTYTFSLRSLTSATTGRKETSNITFPQQVCFWLREAKVFHARWSGKRSKYEMFELQEKSPSRRKRGPVWSHLHRIAPGCLARPAAWHSIIAIAKKLHAGMPRIRPVGHSLCQRHGASCHDDTRGRSTTSARITKCELTLALEVRANFRVGGNVLAREPNQLFLRFPYIMFDWLRNRRPCPPPIPSPLCSASSDLSLPFVSPCPLDLPLLFLTLITSPFPHGPPCIPPCSFFP